MLNRSFDRRRFLALSGAAGLAAILAACGDDDGGDSKSIPSSGGPGATVDNATLRLGYFPNLTHPQPNIGVENGTFARVLGSNVKLETKTFNAGPAVIEALFAGQIDVSYIGPNPAINGFVQSDGKEVRIIAGAASAGALLVVRPGANISSPADFANKKIATPQLGNTQDVALRAWLKKNGLNAKEQGGNVNVLPTANADALALFKKGDIDGAWVPEPWATRLVQEAEGKVFLDEKTLWPNGDFVTTHIIARPGYLSEHPAVIESLLRAHVEVTEYAKASPTEAKSLLNRSIEKLTSAALPVKVLDAAWENFKVTYDPIASSLKKSADDAFALGFLERNPNLSTIYDLTALNKVLKEKQLAEVKGLV
ncbi:MAG: ABC transporter substrate-binding protein [Dehalococcoidia bacterium]